MAFNEEGNMVMPVAPMYGGGGNGGFGGGFGGDWGWIILLLLIAGGGWGNGFGGFGGGAAVADSAALYPWMNQSNQMNEGFRDQMLDASVNGIQNSITSGFGDLQTTLCSGFAGVNATVNGAQNGITSQMYNNTIADLERSFASQTATSQGFSSLASQLAQCCCDNRLATVQTQNVVQNEGAETRLAIQQQTQAILDKMCQAEIDNLKSQNLSLQNQLNMATLRESQTAQNAFIQQGFSNEVDALYNRLSNCPVPSTPVYGRTPIFTCGNGCGCGNNNF